MQISDPFATGRRNVGADAAGALAGPGWILRIEHDSLLSPSTSPFDLTPIQSSSQQQPRAFPAESPCRLSQTENHFTASITPNIRSRQKSYLSLQTPSHLAILAPRFHIYIGHFQVLSTIIPHPTITSIKSFLGCFLLVQFWSSIIVNE